MCSVPCRSAEVELTDLKAGLLPQTNRTGQLASVPLSLHLLRPTFLASSQAERSRQFFPLVRARVGRLLNEAPTLEWSAVARLGNTVL